MTTEPACTPGTDQSVLLITGAAGKTGSHAARLLLERGHRVRALVHRFDDRAARLRDSGAEVNLAHLYSLLIEIPEGSWGTDGQTLSAPEIGQIIGTDKDPERWSELKVNSAKLSADRPS